MSEKEIVSFLDDNLAIVDDMYVQDALEEGRHRWPANMINFLVAECLIEKTKPSPFDVTPICGFFKIARFINRFVRRKIFPVISQLPVCDFWFCFTQESI